jgi:hypothetical protein
LSAATIAPNKVEENEGAMKLEETPYFALINEAELAKMLAHYGKTQPLPRTSGQDSDHMEWVKGKDLEGKPIDIEVHVKVGKLMVAPKWLEKINLDLIAIIQDNCHRAACNKSAVLDEGGIGAVEDRFCTLPPLPGPLMVKRE